MQHFATLPPLALYIHLPWCIKKCPYCDFNSHPAPEHLPEQDYVAALLRDLEQELPLIWGRPIISIFLGGGTPSLFSPEALDTLFSGLRARLKLLPEIEITLEANPGTLDASKFREFRALGINRLSIGVQSFQDAQLTALGRIHDGRAAIAAAEAAHAAGFSDFNLDLMHGLPGQTPASAQADIQQALSLAPSHISYYQLTLEPNTRFATHPPKLPDDEQLAEIEETGQALLTAGGFQQYEVSAWAREGWRCTHNLNYWEFGDYVGIGAGAHGKLTLPAEQRILRRARVKHPHDYMNLAGSAAAFTEQTPSAREAAFEFMLNALRLKNGFPPHLFQERVGLPLSFVREALQASEASGLLHWDIQRIAPTSHGWRFLNDLLQYFLPDRKNQ